MPLRPNDYAAYPDADGRFGDFGGRYVPETLMPLVHGTELGALDALVVSPPRAEDGRCGIALRQGRWKFTRDEKGDASLYDLQRDPHEVDDVQEAHAERAASSASELSSLLGKPQPTAVIGGLDPFRRAILRALRHL